MAVFSDGGVSSPDIYIAVSCICVIIVCTVLNSLVFLHNFQKKSSVARNLYLFLSAADLLTSWVLLGANSVDFLKEKEEECKISEEVTCNERYFWIEVEATLGVKLLSVIGLTMSFAPAHITAFLAVTRFLQIRYPLNPLQLKHVILSLLVTCTWVPVVVGCAMFDVSDREGCNPPAKSNLLTFAWTYCPRVLGIQMNTHQYFWSMIVIAVILQIGAMIASILTITELVKVYLNPVSEGTAKKQNRIRSCSKILLTNLGSLILVIIFVITTLQGESNADEVSMADGITYLMFQTVVPSLISTLNPIIFMLLTPNFNLKSKILAVGNSTTGTVNR